MLVQRAGTFGGGERAMEAVLRGMIMAPDKMLDPDSRNVDRKRFQRRVTGAVDGWV
jgi:ABC-type branched-subunit amino acid transport system ATPase component